MDPQDLISLPKIELHEHLDGSLRPATLVDLAEAAGVRLPDRDPEVLARTLAPGPSSLEDYLRVFDLTVAALQTREALRRAARETLEDWARDGIVYGEVRFAPRLHTWGGLSAAQVVEAVLEGLAEGQAQTGVLWGLILCSLRHAPAETETAALVAAYRSAGVVAFDLAGAEAPYPPSQFRAAFEYCAEHHLAVTCHAGEAAGPGSVREALVVGRALRIGHGIRIAEEWASGPPPEGSTARWIRDRGIPLEVCLTSNLQTRAAASLVDHPAARLRAAGFAITLNTDNRLVSATTLSRELALASETWGWDRQDLLGLQRTSLAAAFCSPATKDRLKARFFS